MKTLVKHLPYLLLPLLFVASLMVFTVLMFPLSSFNIPGAALISIFLIVLISVMSSLVALLVFIMLLAGQKTI